MGWGKDSSISEEKRKTKPKHKKPETQVMQRHSLTQYSNLVLEAVAAGMDVIVTVFPYTGTVLRLAQAMWILL